MLTLSGMILGLALVMRLCPEIPFTHLLIDRLIDQPRAWLAAVQPVDLVYITIILVMFVAAGEMIAVLESAELFLASAVDFAPYLTALGMTSLAVAACADKVALQSRRAKVSFWHIRALDVSASTFAKGARRRREGSGPAGNDDDPAPAFAIAA